MSEPFPVALDDDALIHARDAAQRRFMELDAEVDERAAKAAERALFWKTAQNPKAAGAVIVPEPAPKRVVTGAHKAVRVEDTGAPDGGRPSPAPDAFPPSGAREAGSTGALECASPASIEIDLKPSPEAIAEIEQLRASAADLTIPKFLDRSNPACVVGRG